MSLSRRCGSLLLGLPGLAALGLAACSSAGVEAAPSRGHAGAARESMTGTIDAMVAAGRFKGEAWRMNLAERCAADVKAVSLHVDGDLLVALDRSHQVHAIDRASGSHRWVVQLPGPVTHAIGGTASSLTFVCTDEVVAVERKTGARINGSREAPRASNHLGFFPSGRAVTIGSTAYVGRLAPFGLQAMALGGAFDGWSYATSSAVVDVLALGDGAVAQVIGVTEDGLVAALPPRGASESMWAPGENWYRRLGGTRVVTPLALLGDSLVFGSETGFLYHVDARSGNVRWKVACGNDLRGHEATIAGGAVYQHSDGGVMAFDLATGAAQWTFSGAERAITRISDRVYLDVGGDVTVVDAKSGQELARLGSQGLTVPTVQGGGTLIASDGVNVFALD